MSNKNSKAGVLEAMPVENNLYITNSQVVFVFKRNLEIRKRIFEFEDILKDHFKVPFRSVAIPDEIDPNIIRFESQSQHGHSRIQASQIRISLITTYNEQFKNSYDEVSSYLQEKSAVIIPLVEAESMEYAGYIVELGVYMEEEEVNPFLMKHTKAVAISEDSIDFSVAYSKKYKERYFLNVKCSKFTELKMVLHEPSSTLRPSGEVKHGISVIIDINSKPSFESDNTFDRSLYEELRAETFSIIGSKNIEDFLTGNL